MENVHQESPQGDVQSASVPPGDEPSQSTVKEEVSLSKSGLPPIDDTTSSDIAAFVKQSGDFAEADVSNKEQRDTVRDTDGDSEADKEEADSDTSSLPPTSTAPITTTRGRKRGAAAPASSLQARVKTEPQEESFCMDSTTPVVAASEDEGEEAEEVEPHRRKRSERSERTLPTAAGVSTRRSKSDEQELKMQKVDKSEKEEGPRQRARVKREERSRSHSSRSSNRGRSHSSGSRSHNNNSRSSSRSGSDDDDDPEPSASTSTPRTSFRDASLASSTTQPNISAKNCSASSANTSAASAATRAKHDEALEATTQAAIQAQEHQLRHTLLSIFPPHLRAGEATFTQRSATEREETAQPKSAATTPRAHRCSPEPLLPLLHALCEDKAFVHAAWCRYRDDLAVQRVQNSIQRKRQRHSFSKGSRRPTSTSVGASAVGATKLHRRGTASAKLHDDAASDAVAPATTTDEEDEAEEDAHQPPESEWVEAAPGLTGPPRPMPAVTASISPQRGGSKSLVGGTPASTTATHASAPRAGGELVSGSAEAAVACGFQWTPWRFYREKRRRSTSSSTNNVNNTSIGNNNGNNHDAHTSGRRVQAGSAGAAGSAAGTASPSTLHANTAAQHSSSVAPATAKASDTAVTGVNSTAVHAAAGNGTPAASDLVGVAATPTTTSTATVMASVSGGVPPLLFSEVPSLPVLQVEADVPEDPMAPVEAMTAEEQKNYARYVMSSGKLRSVCRDPYSFLVSRAKEMRIQWERQHPFE